jgi:hypothetical protein
MLNDFLKHEPRSSNIPKSGLANNGSTSVSFPDEFTADGPNP